MHNPRFLLFGLVLIAGCGVRELEGTVSFDGEPIKSGSILFIKTGAESAREGAVIRDGQFRVRLPDGTYDVQISAPKSVGKEWMVSMGEKVEVEKRIDMIPDRYNTKTELKFTVPPSTPRADFALRSQN